MPKICFECGTCHALGTPCAKKRTPAQLSRDFGYYTENLMKQIIKAERKAKKLPGRSNIRYGVKDEV